MTKQNETANETRVSQFDFEIINNRMKPLAEKLIAKFGELRHIQPDKILFVLNHKAAGSKARIVLANTTKIQPKWTEILYQLKNEAYFYMIELYARTTASLDQNQLIALLYSELRKIGPEGKILVPDVHDWWQLVVGLGRKWFHPDETCPNLLDDGVDWQKLMGPYYQPTTNETEEEK